MENEPQIITEEEFLAVVDRDNQQMYDDAVRFQGNSPGFPPRDRGFSNKYAQRNAQRPAKGKRSLETDNPNPVTAGRAFDGTSGWIGYNWVF